MPDKKTAPPDPASTHSTMTEETPMPKRKTAPHDPATPIVLREPRPRGRPASGSCCPHGTHFDAIVAFPKGSHRRRLRVCLPPGTSREEAKAKAAEWTTAAYAKRIQIEDGALAKKPATKSVNSMMGAWLAELAANGTLQQATQVMHRANSHRHIVPHLGSYAPAELTKGRLRGWIRWLSRKYSISTVHNVCGTLTKALEDAIADDWIDLPANPMRHPSVRKLVPRVQTPNPETIAHFSATTAGALIGADTTPPERKVRYLLGLLAGLRDGEISALVFGDVQSRDDVPVIHIHRALKLVGPDGYATPGKTKTSRSAYAVPLHPALERALKWWRAVGWPRTQGRLPQTTDPLFPSPCRDKRHLGKLWRPRSADLLSRDLEAAGLPTTFAGERIDTHALRHSHATMLQATGLPLDVRERLMRHAPVGVGDAHYIATNWPYLHESVSRIVIPIAEELFAVQGAPHAKGAA